MHAKINFGVDSHFKEGDGVIYNWYNGRGKISGKIIAALLFRVCYLSWTIEPDEQQFLEHCRF